MQTLIIFQTGESELKFYTVAGDKTHLNEIFLNSVQDNELLQEELYTLLYDYEGVLRQQDYTLDEWIELVRTTQFPVITCGELP